MMLMAFLFLVACGSAEAETTETGSQEASDTQTIEESDSTEDDSEQTGDDSEQSLGNSGLATLEDEEQETDTTDDGDETGEDKEAGSTDPEEAFEEYGQCLEDAGVDLEAITEQEAFEPDEDFLAASAECDHLLGDSFGDFQLSPEEQAEMADMSLAAAECIRDISGLEIPDDFILQNGEFDAELQQQLEQFEPTPEQEAALDACMQEIFGDLVETAEEGQ